MYSLAQWPHMALWTKPELQCPEDFVAALPDTAETPKRKSMYRRKTRLSKDLISPPITDEPDDDDKEAESPTRKRRLRGKYIYTFTYPYAHIHIHIHIHIHT